MTDQVIDESPAVPLAANATIMGFDYGTEKIGVAVGQLITRSATPLGLIKCSAGKAHWQSLDPLIETWQPQLLIVGDPVNMDNTPSELCQRARKFSRQIKHRYQLPTQLFTELLSTREARLDPRASQKHAIDAVAAALILESWFTTQP